MNELSVLFQPVGRYCRYEVITCSPDDRVVDAAEVMHQRNVSSLVVSDAGKPVGIMTDRDLRNKIAARGIDSRNILVRDVMNTPLITIRDDEFLFEALHRISRHGIHRLVVTDQSGNLAGIMTDSDILRIQTISPQQLVREIEETQDPGELKELHQRVQGLIEHLIGTGVPIRDLVRLIAHLNDRILIRLLELVRNEHFPDLTDRFAFLVLGSEGRGEQTLTTDQDNALVYADDLLPSELLRVEEFSNALIEAVIGIGIPACPGGIMANQPSWRHNLTGWCENLNQWFNTPVPENILKVSMFSDMRTLYGDPGLEQKLRSHVSDRLVGNETFLGHMTGNLLNFRVPLGWFGRIKTEKGVHEGKLDLKKAGIFALTEGVKILALSQGLQEQNTEERLNRLQERNVLSPAETGDLIAVYNSLVYFRLRTQIEAVREGREPDNRMKLDSLNRIELGRLRTALEGVRSFQEMLARRFKLGQML